MSERLVARPLTNKQRFALRAVACGDLKVRELPGYGRVFVEISTHGGNPVGSQIGALRRRRFVRWGKDGLALTVAGAFELFFDADEMLARGNGLSV